MNIKTVVRDLLFPPRCIACRKLLPRGGKDAAFCVSCGEKWKRERHAQCPVCGLQYDLCQCIPSPMKRAGCKKLIKLVPYNKEGERCRVARQVILGVKHQARTRAFDFLAGELAPYLERAVREAERTESLPTVISFLPRSKRAKRENGFDQAEKLALALSERTGIEMRPVLSRVGDGKPQKTLLAAERYENMKHAFAVSGDVKGYRVILADDLVTTGASVAAASHLLRAAGAAEIFAVSIGVTEEKKAHLVRL